MKKLSFFQFLAIIVLSLLFLGCEGSSSPSSKEKNFSGESSSEDPSPKENKSEKITSPLTIYVEGDYFFINFGKHLDGLAKKIDPARIEKIQWESKKVGAGISSDLFEDANGENWFAKLQAMPLCDTGKFYAFLTDGSKISFDMEKWTVEGIDFSLSLDGFLTYGALGKPTVNFSKKRACFELTLENGEIPSSCFTNSSKKNFSSKRICEVRWESEKKYIPGSFSADGNKATMNRISVNDTGQFIVSFEDGSEASLILRNCNVSSFDFILLPNNQITYGTRLEPTIIFGGGIAVMNFGSDEISGFSRKDITPGDILRIQWNSNTVGWAEKSSVFANLEKDLAGNWQVVFYNMPGNGNIGTFSMLINDGTCSIINSSQWKLVNASINWNIGLIEY